MLNVKTETKNLKLDVRYRAYHFALKVIELVDAEVNEIASMIGASLLTLKGKRNAESS